MSKLITKYILKFSTKEVHEQALTTTITWKNDVMHGTHAWVALCSCVLYVTGKVAYRKSSEQNKINS